MQGGGGGGCTPYSIDRFIDVRENISCSHRYRVSMMQFSNIFIFYNINFSYIKSRHIAEGPYPHADFGL